MQTERIHSSPPSSRELNTSLDELKTEIGRQRGRERPEIQAKLQKLEAIAQAWEQWLARARPEANGSESVLSAQRQQWGELLSTLSECRTLEEACDRALRSGLQDGSDRVLMYCFSEQDSTQGTVIAEAVNRGWTPAKGETLPATMFGLDDAADYATASVVTFDGKGETPTPYQQQLLERYQVRASIAVPLRLAGGVWGLLVAQRCRSDAPWNELEIHRFWHAAAEIALVIGDFVYRDRLERQQIRANTAANLIDKIRASQDLQTIFNVATREIRKVLGSDRVAIYRFNPDWSGEFVAESLTSGWTPVVGADGGDPAGIGSNDCSLQDLETNGNGNGNGNGMVRDTYLQDTQGGGYARGQRYSVVNDVYNMGFSRCYLEQLEAYEAKAYINVAIFQGNKLWGLLACYQNSGPRTWQEAEKDLMLQVAGQLGVALQQAEYLAEVQASAQEQARAAERERTKTIIINRIRQAQNIDTIFQVTVQEVRKVLGSDRAIVYRFEEDWQGQVVAESVGSGWVSLLRELNDDRDIKSARADEDRCILRKWASGDITDTDTYLKDTGGGRYMQGQRFCRVDDIYQKDFPACYINSLEKYQARAYILVPVFQGEKLWGLLGTYQNDGPRTWQDSEVELMVQLGDQLAVALQQAEYLETLQQQAREQAIAAEREKTKTIIINRIRQAQNIDTIFQVTVQEVRKVLNSDRAHIYRFEEDWQGRVVAESVGSGWISILRELNDDDDIKSARANQDRCILRKWADGDITDTDTYLKDTQGGRFTRGQRYCRVDDIYQEDFPACYINSLEKYQARAYILVPIFQGEKLWGLLGTYQNDGPRIWQDSEVELMVQLGDQLAVALQQAEYLETLQQQAQEQAIAAEREKTKATIIDKIRQSQNISTIFDVATKEVRRLLKCDRVGIYRFNEDWSGGFVAESLTSGWTPVVTSDGSDPAGIGSNECSLQDLATNGNGKVRDTYLQDTQGGGYARGQRYSVVNDVYDMGFSRCYLEQLEAYEAKAYINVAIFQGNKLWGLLAAYQNDSPRVWQDAERDLMLQVAEQLGIAIQQGEYLAALESQSEQLAAAAERERSAKELLQQRAIALLTAVGPALQGDLRARAPVTTDELGTIADAYNNTLQGLREIVVQVQEAVVQVAQTATESDHAVEGLSQQAQYQARSLSSTVEQVQQMANSTQTMANNARAIEAAVEQSNQTVAAGDRAMNRTVEGIQAIREVVGQASRRIRELGESSQKISRIVNLISDFSKQTQLLSLNASIEATRAGEYGRGFAVVADEVRSLARQSADATKEIEDLVREIRQQTTEAIQITETAIAQVSAGTNLVQESRGELNAIAAATAEIRQLVDNITQSAREQLEQSQSVAQTMQSVSGISTQTTEAAAALSAAFKKSLATAEALQAAVAKFKV